MWGLLSDPGHEDSFADHGDAYAPMCRLLAELARREYAGRVNGVKSLWSFSITTAPGYDEAEGHDTVGVVYHPRRGLFAVGYSEWVSATRNPTHRPVAGRMCESAEAAEVIDRYVLRLLLSRR
jgi:hypothetical protein